jgi:hypothetical protein
MSEFGLAALTIAAVVYGASAISKLRSRQAFSAFRAGLSETALIPAARLRVAAATLAGAESAIAVSAAAAVVTGAFLRGASVLAMAALAGGVLLTGVLAAGITLVVRRGTRARCACFGSTADLPLGTPHLVRNAILLALLAAGLAGARAGRSWPGWGAGLLAVAAGAVAGLLLIRFDDLASLFGPVPQPPARAGQAVKTGRS